MAKPKATSRTVMDYHEAAAFIEAKLGYPLCDTLRSLDHYGAWCRHHDLVPDGSSREQFRQYSVAADGEAMRPEYRNYWHYLVDRCDVNNGGTIIISRDLLDDAEPWQAEITQSFMDEFGDGCEYETTW